LLEAMAAGLPVVAVDSGGPREFVEHGRTGVLAPSGSPDALAAAIGPLLESRDLRSALGEAGRAKFRAEFTEAAVCKRFSAELGRVATTRHGKTAGHRGALRTVKRGPSD
jgi:glycosyltransferase involved in cell wall biosynthesis